MGLGCGLGCSRWRLAAFDLVAQDQHPDGQQDLDDDFQPQKGVAEEAVVSVGGVLEDVQEQQDRGAQHNNPEDPPADSAVLCCHFTPLSSRCGISTSSETAS